MKKDSPSVAILAGGLAKRLQPITKNIPKALVEIGGSPFIIYQLELLRHRGIEHAVICAGYLGELIQDALGDGSKWQMKIEYSFDGPKLLGTGGAIVQAFSLLPDSFFVLYGDSYLECDYQSVWNAFTNSHKSGLMTIFRNEDHWDSSNVDFQNGKIISYSKSHRTFAMKYIDYGLGAFHKKAFQDFVTGTFFDLAQVYENLILRNDLAGYEVFERFYEIGSPNGLEETRAHLVSRK